MKFVELKKDCFYIKGEIHYNEFRHAGGGIELKERIMSFDDHSYNDNEYMIVSVPPIMKIRIYIPYGYVLYDILDKVQVIDIIGHEKKVTIDLKNDHYANLILGIAEYKFDCPHRYMQGRNCFARIENGYVVHHLLRHYFIVLRVKEFLSIDRSVFTEKELLEANREYDEDFLIKMPKDFPFKDVDADSFLCTPFKLDNYIATINRCYNKVEHYECSHPKMVFDVCIHSEYILKLKICKFYFRSVLNEYNKESLMSAPSFIKAKALYSIVREEFGGLLYEEETEPELCLIPLGVSDNSYGGCTLYKDRQTKNATNVLDRYVVYVPFYELFYAKYSAYEITKYVCSIIDLENDASLGNHVVFSIVREFLRTLLEDIKPLFTKTDYKICLQEINHINDWLDKKSSLLLMSSVKTLCKYYSNLNQKKNEKKRSKKCLRTNVGNIG